MKTNTRALNKLALLLGFLLMCCTLGARAQSKPEAAREVEKLLQKATGQKVLNFVGQEEKVVSQVFGEQLMSVTLKSKSSDTNWTSEYTQIPWERMQTYFYGPAKGNDNVYELHIKFSSPMKYRHFYDAANKGEEDTSSTIELYFKKSDLDKIKQYMDIINK
jgi:hypothetical protein